MKFKNSIKKITKTQFLYIFLRGTVVIAFILFFVQGDWVDAVSTAGIFLLMTVPTFLKERYKTQTPLELDVALSVFVYATLFLGSFHNYY